MHYNLDYQVNVWFPHVCWKLPNVISSLTYPWQSENKSMALLREKTEVQSQLEENEEDMADVMKKYKALVQQQTVDHITLNDQLRQIEELTTERDKLRSEVLSRALALKHTLMQWAFEVTYMHFSSFLSVIKHCAWTISKNLFDPNIIYASGGRFTNILKYT